MSYLLRLIKNVVQLPKRRATVRYMFSTVISIVALLGAAVITSTETSHIRLEASQNTVMAGETFSVNVYAYAHVPVNAVDITLTFDTKNVSIEGVDKGQSVLTIWTEEPKIEGNKVTLRGGTFRKGFVTEHKIAAIKLKAKNTGQSEVSASEVMLLAGDGKGTPVKVADSSNSKVSLYVYDENTDPETIGVTVAVRVVTDINGDGKVTLSDVSAFMAAWASKSTVYDFSGDGRMTFRDFSIILAALITR